MKANEIKVKKLLSAHDTQFIIPIFQRNYNWSREQCKQLLDDIIEVGDDSKKNAHFIGSIVFLQEDLYSTSDITQLTIIDGQQRLTTLTLIYIVIYKLAIEWKNENLKTEIYETYLINKFSKEEKIEEKKLKLRPSENNDTALKYLLKDNDDEKFNDFSRLIENFDYFKSRIKENNYKTILKGLSKLMFVEISLGRKDDDNPQKIFESLNSTGLALDESDLIRNYILMGLKPKEQKDIYKNFWENIENQAKDIEKNENKVSDFIRDYLILKNKQIPKKKKVYIEFKKKYPITTFEELKENLSEINQLVYCYNKLINPTKESDKEISIQLKYIKRQEINAAFPFLLQVYDDFVNQKIIDKKTFIQILELIQSFCFRRFIVGISSNSTIFMNLYDKVDTSNYLYSLQKVLIKFSGRKKFPTNEEIRNALKMKDIYGMNSQNRIHLLERLEHFDNNERVDIENNPITIEHIFPQNPKEAVWKKGLETEEYNRIKEDYLHTLGNLTLSGHNPKMGNKSFKEKGLIGYKDSHLWLNKDLSELEKWDIKAIEDRRERLTNRFLEVWEYPKIEIQEESTNDEVNIFDAELPEKYQKLEYVKFDGQRLDITNITDLYLEILKQLFELEEEKFFNTELGKKIKITKNKGELRAPEVLNEDKTYFIEKNSNSKVKFELIKYALEIFELEDELFIKYTDLKEDD